jgi:hypothetical protein
MAARRLAGFEQKELDALESLDTSKKRVNEELQK